MPVLIISIAVSFGLILYLVQKKVNLGFATMGGGILLALLAGVPPVKTAKIFFFALIDRGTVELMVCVFLIIVLSKMMQEYGVLNKMVDYLERVFGNPKYLLFLIPCLLSTFTATGSAIVAAPVIDTLGERTKISKAKRAAINLYIRHAWYFVLPLSVSLLNAAYVAGIPIIDLVVAQSPVALACLVAGYLVYIAPIKVEKKETQGNYSREAVSKALLYSAPLLLCVILVIWLPFYIALLASCVLTYVIRVNDKNLLDILKKHAKGYNLILAVAGVMVFKDIILNMQVMMKDIMAWGIPLWLVGIILAVLLAFIAGSTQIVTAMLYPLLLPLFPPGEVLAAAVLIYTTGFTSYYISPIHLCQVLTNEFFEVSLTELYREYYVTLPVMFIAGVATFFLLR
jgi:integral membrane protein (TIGR00529 family)